MLTWPDPLSRIIDNIVQGGTMSESAPLPPPRKLPLTFMERSPVDETRLKWQGAGNIPLALYCIFGAGGVGGVFVGILFLLLALATWVIAFRAGWNWYSIPPDYQRVIVAVGVAIGVTFTYIFF